MKQHRWLALGAASMITDQAKEWAGLTGTGIAHTPLEVSFSTIVCVVCGETYGSALPECFGSLREESRTDHLWEAFLTVPVTNDEAAAWNDPDGDFNPGWPRSHRCYLRALRSRCRLADDACPERVFWPDAPSDEMSFDPERIPDGTVVRAKPFGYDDPGRPNEGNAHVRGDRPGGRGSPGEETVIAGAHRLRCGRRRRRTRFDQTVFGATRERP